MSVSPGGSSQHGLRAGGEAGAEGLTSAEVSAWMLEAGYRLSESASREAADLRALAAVRAMGPADQPVP